MARAHSRLQPASNIFGSRKFGVAARLGREREVTARSWPDRKASIKSSPRPKSDRFLVCASFCAYAAPPAVSYILCSVCVPIFSMCVPSAAFRRRNLLPASLTDRAAPPPPPPLCPLSLSLPAAQTFAMPVKTEVCSFLETKCVAWRSWRRGRLFAALRGWARGVGVATVACRLPYPARASLPPRAGSTLAMAPVSCRARGCSSS